MQFSVVIPTSGNYQSLAPSLKSLWSQSLSDFEVIVVISPPKPYLRKTLTKISAKEPRLKFLELDQAGINKARNWGAQMARGHVVFFMDDNCTLPDKDYLKRLESFFWDHQDAVGVGGFYMSPKGASSNCKAYNTILNAWLLKSGQKGPQVLVGGCSAFCRQDFLEAGGYLEDLNIGGEQSELFSKLTENKKVYLDRRLSLNHSFNGATSRLLQNSWRHGREIGKDGNHSMSWRVRHQYFRQALKMHEQLSPVGQAITYGQAGVYNLGLQLGRLSRKVKNPSQQSH